MPSSTLSCVLVVSPPRSRKNWTYRELIAAPPGQATLFDLNGARIAYKYESLAARSSHSTASPGVEIIKKRARLNQRRRIMMCARSPSLGEDCPYAGEGHLNWKLLGGSVARPRKKEETGERARAREREKSKINNGAAAFPCFNISLLPDFLPARPFPPPPYNRLALIRR